MRGRGTRWLLLALVPALAFAGTRHHVKHEYWTDEFDPLFRKYTKHYFGAHFDWHWFKAQGIAESALDPNARSPMGARGIMQILPATYREIKEHNFFLAGIDQPRWNIAAGIFYDRLMYRKWKQNHGIGSAERLKFAFGSYNAGYGNISKAHRRATKQLGEEATRWDQVAKFAPRETRLYVDRIQDLMRVVD